MKLKWGFSEVWSLSLVVKIVLAIFIPLSLDESYYWVWGQNPQLSYYDHPPMVGWLFFLGRAFEFMGGASARIPGVLIGHCTILIWNEILKPYFNDKQRALFALLIIASPLVGIGSLIQTPDVSFVFFWSLSIFALIHALKTQSLKWYLLLGASLGLGFCSKYPIVLFIPTLFLYLAFEKKFREVNWLYAFFAVITGLIFCSPVLIWNAQNDWISFKFQLSHGLVSQKWNPLWPVKYLAEQFAFIFPAIVIYFVVSIRQKLVPQNLRILLYFAIFPIAFFLYSAFKARVEPNWPIAAYPSIMAVAFFTMQKSAWAKRTIAIWLILFSLVVVETFLPFIPIPPAKKKTNEFKKYDAFISQARELEPLYANSYQLASSMSYRLKRQIPKLQGMSRKDFYDFFPPAHANSDRFFVLIEGDTPLPEWALYEGYEIVTTLKVDGDVSGRLKIIEVRKRAKAPDS